MLYEQHVKLEEFIKHTLLRENVIEGRLNADAVYDIHIDSEKYIKLAEECLEIVKSTEAKVIGIDVEKMLIQNLRTMSHLSDVTAICWGDSYSENVKNLTIALQNVGILTKNTLDLILNPPTPE